MCEDLRRSSVTSLLSEVIFSLPSAEASSGASLQLFTDSKVFFRSWFESRSGLQRRTSDKMAVELAEEEVRGAKISFKIDAAG